MDTSLPQSITKGEAEYGTIYVIPSSPINALGTNFKSGISYMCHSERKRGYLILLNHFRFRQDDREDYYFQ